MTKTEQLRQGLLASGAVLLAEQRSSKYEVYRLHFSHNPLSRNGHNEPSVVRYFFLGKSAGLRISQRPVKAESHPVSKATYDRILARGIK